MQTGKMNKMRLKFQIANVSSIVTIDTIVGQFFRNRGALHDDKIVNLGHDLPYNHRINDGRKRGPTPAIETSGEQFHRAFTSTCCVHLPSDLHHRMLPLRPERKMH